MVYSLSTVTRQGVLIGMQKQLLNRPDMLGTPGRHRGGDVAGGVGILSHVLLFAMDESPDFVDLDMRGMQVA